jgi:cyclopropane fatty-acyl-phospholipid synthase-like methyltransferase
MRIVKKNLKNKTRYETQFKFYNVVALPAMLCESEFWTNKAKGITRTQAAEMRYFRTVKAWAYSDKIKK